MSYIAVDPGTTESAYVIYESGRILDKGILHNLDLRNKLSDWFMDSDRPEKLYIEMVASFGMSVGAEIFETVLWTGRFIEAWQGTFEKVYRKDVKIGLCGTMRAKDANIRQALIDHFGPGKELAVGRKASPGPLYGVSKDVWAALAVAVFIEKRHMNLNRRSHV